MSHRQLSRRVGRTAAAIAALSTAFVGLYAFAPDGARASGPALSVGGLLLNARRSPLSGATVQLFSQHTNRKTLVTTDKPLASMTSATGLFSFRVPVSKVATNSAGGKTMGLMVTNAAGKPLLWQNVSATRSPKTGTWQIVGNGTGLSLLKGGDLLGSVYEVGKGVVGDLGSTLSTLAPRVSAALGSGYSVAPADASEVLTAPKGQAVAATTAPRLAPRVVAASTPPSALKGKCPSGAVVQYAWRPTGRTKYVMAPTKLLQDTSRAKTAWHINDTKTTTLGVAVNMSGDKYGGGLEASISQESGLDWVPTDPNDHEKLFKEKWEYIQQRQYCAYETYTADGMMPKSSYTGLTEWVPDHQTGGNVEPASKIYTKCGGPGPKYHDPYRVRTSVEKQTTAYYAGFISIVGVTLNTGQQTTSSDTYVIHPDKGKVAHFCGNDNGPSFATYAKETDRR